MHDFINEGSWQRISTKDSTHKISEFQNLLQ
jgi:hypothetical protein